MHEHLLTELRAAHRPAVRIAGVMPMPMHSPQVTTLMRGMMANRVTPTLAPAIEAMSAVPHGVVVHCAVVARVVHDMMSARLGGMVIHACQCPRAGQRQAGSHEYGQERK